MPWLIFSLAAVCIRSKVLWETQNTFQIISGQRNGAGLRQAPGGVDGWAQAQAGPVPNHFVNNLSKNIRTCIEQPSGKIRRVFGGREGTGQ